jgi:hypothetical protein
MDVRALSMRERALVILTALSLVAVFLYSAGSLAEGGARATMADWERARERAPGIGCGMCGQLARYDVSRLVRKQGEVVGRVPIGLRCDAHREAESERAETGLYTGWLLQAFGALLFGLAALTSAGPMWRGEPHPLAPPPLVRPVRQAAAALGLAIWTSVFAYILAVSFKDAYATLPLWSAMGGMLCLWLYDLLSGGEYLRCTGCSWHGNLEDVRYTGGTCSRCGAVHFRVQELLRAHRVGIKTTYHFRMMVGLTLGQLEELDRDGRIWKEPRGSWSPPRAAASAMA